MTDTRPIPLNSVPAAVEIRPAPGPWDLRNANREIIDAKRRIVAKAVIQHLDPPGTMDVNARLIAAAPTMLAALDLVEAFAVSEEKMGDDALWTDDFRELFEAARAAIAKAIGVRQ